VALRTNTIITNNRNRTAVRTHRKHFSSILFAAITLPTEVATSNNKVPIVDFRALDHKFLHLHRHKERVEDISAIYNGQRLAQSGVEHTKIFLAATQIPFRPRPHYLISRQESLSPQLLMKMTIHSDPQRIYKWRMKRKNLK
jgi:hypothetical protein